MTSIPTQNDLANLGVRIAADGFGPHELQVLQLVRIAAEAGASETIVDLLLDRQATPTLRTRAFATLARDWSTHQHSLAVACEAAAFDASIEPFLTAWAAHEDLERMAS